MLFLPARSPEINLIDLMWNMLVGRLKTWDLASPRRQRNAVTLAAR